MQWIKRALPAFLAAPAVVLLTALAVVAQTDVAEGERIFQKNCALCHAGDATGGRGPDLSRGMYRNATTDAQLITIVQNGIMGTGMPWTGLSDRKASQVVAYLRSLSARGEPILGDPANGEALFFGAGSCSSCHMVNGRGGRQGPDLSWVGWRRGPDYLRTAIVDPSDEVEPRWWTAQGVTSTGSQFAGILVDEDQFTVRLLDENDELRTLKKQDLEQFERTKTSRMPMFGDALSDEQIVDLVAYLAGLRGGSQ